VLGLKKNQLRLVVLPLSGLLMDKNENRDYNKDITHVTDYISEVFTTSSFYNPGGDDSKPPPYSSSSVPQLFDLEPSLILQIKLNSIKRNANNKALKEEELKTEEQKQRKQVLNVISSWMVEIIKSVIGASYGCV
jgi:hypothetical protein